MQANAPTAVDVPSCKVGTRRSKLTVDDVSVKLEFKQHCANVHIDNCAMVHKLGVQVCVHLKVPAVVVPGTKHPRSQFMFTFLTDAESDNVFCALKENVTQHHDFTDSACFTSSCSTYSIAFGESALCVKAGSQRHVVPFPDVMSVLFQRTRGGMATFDMHICTCSDVITVERISHCYMHGAAACFSAIGVNVIDAGPDPYPTSIIRNELRACTAEHLIRYDCTKDTQRSTTREHMFALFDVSVQSEDEGDEQSGDDEWMGSDLTEDDEDEDEDEDEEEEEEDDGEEEQESELSDSDSTDSEDYE